MPNDPRFTNKLPPGVIVKHGRVIPCRPRASRTESLFNSQSFTHILPDPTHLDDALEYLCSKNPEKDEVIVSTMELMSVSRRAAAIISVTYDRIQESIKGLITANTEEEKLAAVGETQRAMELLMSMGFLAGTAIGFATGLEMEVDDGDGDGDEGPDFDNPMI